MEPDSTEPASGKVKSVESAYLVNLSPVEATMNDSDCRFSGSRLTAALREAALWSPRRKAGQLFLLAFPGDDPSPAERMIQEYNLCGCYLSQDNATTFEAAQRLTQALNSASRHHGVDAPLLLGVDQEGAWSILTPESTSGPGNMALGAIPPARTKDMYRIIGREMTDAGFTLLLAPCSDVNTDPDSPIIGTRSFGEIPAQVAMRVAAAVQGAAESGILTTVKHFPGHGSTHVDTHRRIPVVDKTRPHLEESDFLPFRAGIDAGADVVMTSHILFSDLDSRMPATLSEKILGGVLRRDMGFRGLILSDSMNMGAIRRNYSPGEAAVLALKAGVDVIMLSEEHYDHSEAYLETQKACIHAVEDAIISGVLGFDEVMGKLERILATRLRACQVPERQRAQTGQGASVRASSPAEADAKETEASIAEEACALLIDEGGVWPLPDDGVLYVNATPRSSYPRMLNPRGIGPNQRVPAFDSFREELAGLRPGSRFLEADEFLVSPDTIARAKRIVLVTEDYPLPGEDFETRTQRELVRAVVGAHPEKCVVVGLRSPYEVKEYPGLKAYLCAFSSRSCSARAAARFLHAGHRGGLSPVSFTAH